MKKFLVTLGMVAVTITGGARAVDAATIVFGNQASNPGGQITVTTNPAGPALLISNAVIDEVVRLSPLPLVEFAVGGACGPASNLGCLTVLTGAFLGVAADNPDRFLFSTVGAGVAISGTADGASGVLFAGLFDGPTIALQFDRNPPALGGGYSGTGSLQGALGVGMLNATLAAALGVNPLVISGTDSNNFTNFAFTLAGAPAGTAPVTRNTIQLMTSEQVAVPIPEPGLMMLLGTGLFGVASAARRRITKSRNAA